MTDIRTPTPAEQHKANEASTYIVNQLGGAKFFRVTGAQVFNNWQGVSISLEGHIRRVTIRLLAFDAFRVVSWAGQGAKLAAVRVQEPVRGQDLVAAYNKAVEAIN